MLGPVLVFSLRHRLGIHLGIAPSCAENKRDGCQCKRTHHYGAAHGAVDDVDKSFLAARVLCCITTCSTRVFFRNSHKVVSMVRQMPLVTTRSGANDLTFLVPKSQESIKKQSAYVEVGQVATNTIIRECAVGCKTCGLAPSKHGGSRGSRFEFHACLPCSCQSQAGQGV